MPQKKAVETPSVVMEIRRPDWKTVCLEIVGELPGLLMDRYDDGLGKDGKKPPTDKNITVDASIKRALHTLKKPDGKLKYGFPAAGFQAAVINAARWSSYDMTKIRGCVMVIPGLDGLVPITTPGYEVFRRGKKVGGNKTIVAHSPVFSEWSCRVMVEYMENYIPLDDVIMLFNIAGKSVGIGGFAPRCKCGGPFGRFHVDGVSAV